MKKGDKKGAIAIETVLGVVKVLVIAVLILAGAYVIFTGKLQGAVAKIGDLLRFRR